jgi:alpha/beta superfamily hydrolase
MGKDYWASLYRKIVILDATHFFQRKLHPFAFAFASASELENLGFPSK